MTKAVIPLVDESAIVQTVLQRLDRLRAKKQELEKAKRDIPTGGAADLLIAEAVEGGKTLPNFTSMRLHNQESLGAVERALKGAEADLTAARSKAALETRVGLSLRRRELLRTLDKALGQVLSAVDALEEFQTEAERAGVSPTGSPWRFCLLSAAGLDAGQMRQALINWRREFAEDGFSTQPMEIVRHAVA